MSEYVTSEEVVSSLLRHDKDLPSWDLINEQYQQVIAHWKTTDRSNISKNHHDPNAHQSKIEHWKAPAHFDTDKSYHDHGLSLSAHFDISMSYHDQQARLNYNVLQSNDYFPSSSDDNHSAHFRFEDLPPSFDHNALDPFASTNANINTFKKFDHSNSHVAQAPDLVDLKRMHNGITHSLINSLPKHSPSSVQPSALTSNQQLQGWPSQFQQQNLLIGHQQQYGNQQQQGRFPMNIIAPYLLSSLTAQQMQQIVPPLPVTLSPWTEEPADDRSVSPSSVMLDEERMNDHQATRKRKRQDDDQAVKQQAKEGARKRRKDHKIKYKSELNSMKDSDEPLTREFCEDLLNQCKQLPLAADSQAAKAFDECKRLFDQAVNEKLTIAVCGLPGAGKSTLINRLAVKYSVAGTEWGRLPLPALTQAESLTAAPIKLIHSTEPFARLIYTDGEVKHLDIKPMLVDAASASELHVLKQISTFLSQESTIISESLRKSLESKMNVKLQHSPSVDQQSSSSEPITPHRHVRCFELGFTWHFNQHATLVDFPGYEQQYLDQTKAELSGADGVIILSSRRAATEELKTAFEYGAFSQIDKTPWLMNVYRDAHSLTDDNSQSLSQATSQSSADTPTRLPVAGAIGKAMTDFYNDLKILPVVGQSVHRSEFFTSLMANALEKAIPVDSPDYTDDISRFYEATEAHLRACFDEFIARIMNGVWMNFVKHISILMFFVRRELLSLKNDDVIELGENGQSYAEAESPNNKSSNGKNLFQLVYDIQNQVSDMFAAESESIAKHISKMIKEHQEKHISKLIKEHQDSEAISGLLSLNKPPANQESTMGPQFCQYFNQILLQIDRRFVEFYTNEVAHHAKKFLPEDDLKSLFFDRQLNDHRFAVRDLLTREILGLPLNEILSSHYDNALTTFQEMLDRWKKQLSSVAVESAIRVIQMILSAEENRAQKQVTNEHSELCYDIQAKANAALEHQNKIADERMIMIGKELNNKPINDSPIDDSQYRGKTAVHGLTTRSMLPAAQMIQSISRVTKGRHDYDRASLEKFIEVPRSVSKLEVRIVDDADELLVGQPFNLITVTRCSDPLDKNQAMPFSITLSESLNNRLVDYCKQLKRCFARGVPRKEQQWLFPCSTIFRTNNPKIFHMNGLVDYAFDSLEFLHLLLLTPDQVTWAQEMKEKIVGVDAASNTLELKTKKDAHRNGGKVIVALPAADIPAASLLDLSKEIMHYFKFDFHWRIHEYLRVSELQAVTVSARVCTVARAMLSIQIPLFGVYKYVIEEMQAQLMQHHVNLTSNIDELVDSRVHVRNAKGRVSKAATNEVYSLLDKMRSVSTSSTTGQLELPTTDQLDELYQALKFGLYNAYQMLKADSTDDHALKLKVACESVLASIHPWKALRMVCFYPTQFLLHNAISRFPDLQHVYQTTKNARIFVLDHTSSLEDLSFSQAMNARAKSPKKRSRAKMKRGKEEKEVDPVLEAEVEFTVAVKNVFDSAVITSASFGAEHTTRAVALAKRAQRDSRS